MGHAHIHGSNLLIIGVENQINVLLVLLLLYYGFQK